jgi:branched-chain amino acid transport system substrate-binding protein
MAIPRPLEYNHLGVLVPLTGRYARFGNAFLAGVHQAASSVPPPFGQSWRIVHEDTEGDVVTAALAARRLVEDRGSGVLIGALLSSTTAIAALVADHLGVPLVSPTATHERLSLLGARVLQTNLTGPAEAEILARLACDVLLKKRFAIIGPDTPEGIGHAEAFKNSVERRGGSVVRREVFDAAAIDFRPQIERVRAVRPEVIFAPASVDQMILLGPQLDFYRAGALVFGTSEWNSSRLLQRAGSVLERAIFPAREVLYPEDWPADFEKRWPVGEHDEEATRIARSAYLAARLVLQTMADAGEGEADFLVSRLHDGLSGGWGLPGAAETFSGAVRLVENGQIMPFPGHLYTEALHRQARADTTGGDADDAVTEEAEAIPQRMPWPAAADTTGRLMHGG